MLSSPAARERLLPGWRYVGVRGEKRNIYGYKHVDSPPVRTHFWPLLTDNSIHIRTIHSPTLHAELVARDNSTIILRTPRRFIYDTDPAGTRRKFGSTDIVTIKLAGLEDDPELRQVRLQVANRAGQTWLYEGVRTVSGWGMMKWLVLSISVFVVGFFVTRFLKHRWPDPPSGQAVGARA